MRLFWYLTIRLLCGRLRLRTLCAFLVLIYYWSSIYRVRSLYSCKTFLKWSSIHYWNDGQKCCKALQWKNWKYSKIEDNYILGDCWLLYWYKPTIKICGTFVIIVGCTTIRKIMYFYSFNKYRWTWVEGGLDRLHDLWLQKDLYIKSAGKIRFLINKR